MLYMKFLLNTVNNNENDYEDANIFKKKIIITLIPSIY